MKASELRIGNLVYHGGKPIELRSVDIYNFDKTEVKFFAIPLTEDWLVGFGFDWIEEDRIWTLTVCPQGSFSITFTYQDDFSLALSDSPQMIAEICPAMRLFKYVHQLQNLYFALTGEELQIKVE